MKPGRKPRGRYHHGDLSNALTDAATALARAGGPEAVVMREAARQVGVSATAAYRHFASHDDLVRAVKQRSLLALAEAMRAELATTPPVPARPGRRRGATPAAGIALTRLEAIGRAYLRFALAEPGLFRTAFCRADRPAGADPAGAEPAGAEPAGTEGIDGPAGGMAEDAAYQLLGQVLDELVNAGVLAADRRPFAELAAWATVHGLANLLLDGPLAALPEQAQTAVIDRANEMVLTGLTTPRTPRYGAGSAAVRSPHGASPRS